MTQIPSTKEFNRVDFQRMYKELTDPTIREANKRKTERAARVAARKADYGL